MLQLEKLPPSGEYVGSLGDLKSPRVGTGLHRHVFWPKMPKDQEPGEQMPPRSYPANPLATCGLKWSYWFSLFHCDVIGNFFAKRSWPLLTVYFSSLCDNVHHHYQRLLGLPQ